MENEEKRYIIRYKFNAEWGIKKMELFYRDSK